MCYFYNTLYLLQCIYKYTQLGNCVYFNDTSILYEYRTKINPNTDNLTYGYCTVHYAFFRDVRDWRALSTDYGS